MTSASLGGDKVANSLDARGKVIEGAVTGVVAAVLGFLTDRLLIWLTDLSLIQTLVLGCAAAAAAGAAILELLARRHRRPMLGELQAPSPTLTDVHDGSDPAVRFWHTIADREKHGKDVRALLSGAQRRVIITGIGLHYIVKYCSSELRTALSSGILVGIVMSKPTQKNIGFYSRYSRDVDKTLGVTHEMYSTFAQSLDTRQQECFAFYHTEVPLTHSIGLYDNSLYVSEFCIDCASSVSPSFSPPPGSRAHALFISELKTLLKESLRKYGDGHAKLIGSLD
jgi:hypothetical protein